MKWALSQLFRYNKQPFSFEETYDFHDRITSLDDVIDLTPVSIHGTGRNLDGDRYLFQIHIEATFTLACARTLEPVLYPISMDVEEIFDTVDDGEVNLIQKNTIDLEDVVWENVYLEKPMRVFKEDTEEVVSFDIDEKSFYLENETSKEDHKRRKR